MNPAALRHAHRASTCHPTAHCGRLQGIVGGLHWTTSLFGQLVGRSDDGLDVILRIDKYSKSIHNGCSFMRIDQQSVSDEKQQSVINSVVLSVAVS